MALNPELADNVCDIFSKPDIRSVSKRIWLFIVHVNRLLTIHMNYGKAFTGKMNNILSCRLLVCKFDALWVND